MLCRFGARWGGRSDRDELDRADDLDLFTVVASYAAFAIERSQELLGDLIYLMARKRLRAVARSVGPRPSIRMRWGCS